MDEKILIRDLLDECYEIYAFNEKALILHVYTLMKQSKRNVTVAKIRENFKDKEKIEKYRLFLLKIMDSFKTEIEEYKEITNFDITKANSTLLYCYTNLSIIRKLNADKKKILEKELVDILFYAENMLEEVKKTFEL